jgi:uncharacterized membrane protein YphA (DoxX/SURF4 family)
LAFALEHGHEGYAATSVDRDATCSQIYLEPFLTGLAPADCSCSVPPLAFAVAVVVELGCGLLVIIGYRARAAALVLALFSATTAAVAR